MPELHLITNNYTSASSDHSSYQNDLISHHDSIDNFEDVAVLRKIVESSTAPLFLLSSCLPESSTVPDRQSLETIQASKTATWYPTTSNSFAEFTVHCLGIKMASLWFTLWNSGTIIVPATELQKVLRQSNSLHEVMIKLNWGHSETSNNPKKVDSINWSDTSVELPALAPKNQRKEIKFVDALILDMEAWLPDSFDRFSPDFTAIRAGLYQWYDALEISHEYSQDAQHSGKNNAADYWHAIMHRREPDDSNAKYWYRHVGTHPIFPELARWSNQINDQGNRGTTWDPFAFVDFCSGSRKGSNDSQIALRIQAVEMVLLMQQTMQDAQ